MFAALLLLALQDEAQVGKPCPDLALKSVEGKEVKLSDWRKSGDKEGSIVLAVFWSIECPAGAAVIPRIDAAAERLDKEGIRLVCVCSYGETAEQLRGYAKDHALKYPLYDDSDTKAAQRLGAVVTTHSVLINPEGKVVYIGDIVAKPDESTYDGIQAALDLKAGKPLKKTEVQAKGG